MSWWKPAVDDQDAPQRSWQVLADAVRSHMRDADVETVRIVVAVAGLLACVAYADREYTQAEEQQIREELSRIHGLSDAGREVVCSILRERLRELTVTAAQNYVRELRELADRALRVEVLDILMDLAAADDVVSTEETNLLRRTAQGLGLTSDDYQAAQDRHREKLSVLKG